MRSDTCSIISKNYANESKPEENYEKLILIKETSARPSSGISSTLLKHKFSRGIGNISATVDSFNKKSQLNYFTGSDMLHGESYK